MAVPNIGEMMTMAIESRTKMLADNVSDNTALLNRLKARGKIKPVTGGTSIRQELEYAENETYKRFSGYEVLDISPQDVFDSAQFELRQVAVAVSASGRDELINAGPEQMIPLVASRVRNAQRTMTNGLSGDLYSDGLASGGKQIDGLQAGILTTAHASQTGTYGSINRANHEFWRNRQTTGTTYTSSNIIAAMMSMWTQLCRNMDKVDLIPADNNYYSAFWQALQTQQRFMSSDMGRAGFVSLKFVTADVILDGGVGGSCPANRMFFLNTDYLHWRPHRDRNMAPSRNRYAYNQDAYVKFILWAGNLTCSNLSLQGVLGSA